MKPNPVKQFVFATAMLVVLCPALLSSCSTFRTFVGNSISTVFDPTVSTLGQFHIRLIECTGSTTLQSVTAIIEITNTGTNSRAYIGGSTNGSLAVASDGSTIKPYSSTGKYCELPTNVTVRVAIERIEPVMPGTPFFQILRIGIGDGNDNKAEFRHVPIVWTN
jgi:hypothetical protein